MVPRVTRRSRREEGGECWRLCVCLCVAVWDEERDDDEGKEEG